MSPRKPRNRVPDPHERRSMALMRLMDCSPGRKMAWDMCLRICFRSGCTNQEIQVVWNEDIRRIQKLREEFEDESG
jgi:hypothetical protein